MSRPDLHFYNRGGYGSEWYMYVEERTCMVCGEKARCLSIDVNGEYGCDVCLACIEKLEAATCAFELDEALQASLSRRSL